MYGEMVTLTNDFHSMPTKHKPIPQNFNKSSLFSRLALQGYGCVDGHALPKRHCGHHWPCNVVAWCIGELTRCGETVSTGPSGLCVKKIKRVEAAGRWGCGCTYFNQLLCEL